MPQLICIKAFGTYKPGDDAGYVADDAEYSTEFFAPADHPDAEHALSKAEQLRAELAALENGSGE